MFIQILDHPRSQLILNQLIASESNRFLIN